MSSNPKSAHNQPTADPVAHFKAIPWCAKLLSDKSVLQVIVPDRTPLASTESALVRESLNTASTVKACVTFLRYIKPTAPASETGEDKKNPFLQLCCLLDLGSGINGYAKTAHGGIFGVIFDEVMGTTANMQARE
jgi:hypothetical protein